MKTSKFKMTEIGEIPADWEVKRIDQCGDIVTGATPPREIPELWGGSFYWISAKDFKRKYIFSSEEKVTEAGKRYCRVLPENSVLVTCIASIGLNAIAKRQCATNQQINAVVCRECHYEYFYYQCCFNESRLRQMAGQTAVPIIGKRQFEEFSIAMPKEVNEQKAIAKALSDVDALIAAQQELIEKKRAIKQGAMQELLTGKKRLVGFKNSESSCLCASVLKKDAGTVEGGFNTETQRRRGSEFKMTEIGLIPEDWEVKRIGDMGQVVTGSTPPRKNSANWGGDFNWISAKDFNGKYISKTEEHITEAGKRFCRLLPENSVLVTCIASIGLNAITKKACATNQQINAVVCRVDLPEYLYYQICYRNGDLKLLAGQTAVPIIGKKQFEDVLIPVPSLPEQRAIAEVLSDMDAEIEALEAKWAKYESIKQGMMQELLTGKTRLKGV